MLAAPPQTLQAPSPHSSIGDEFNSLQILALDSSLNQCLFFFLLFIFHRSVAVPPVVPDLLSDDDSTHFDDIPDPDSGEEFFPTPKVGFEVSLRHIMLWHI